MTDRDILVEHLELAEALLDKVKGRQIDNLYATKQDRKAYAKHLKIFNAGTNFRERVALGGNRVGKSTLGATETTYHCTGQYPEWWQGYRFDHPITAWAAGETLAASRDIVQAKLMGEPHAIGQGLLPAQTLIDIRKKSGVPDGIDSVRIKHVSGGTSTLQFMAKP
jgi:hypothetical protein